MLYLTCTKISSVDLALYEVSRAKDCVSMDCGTLFLYNLMLSGLTVSLIWSVDVLVSAGLIYCL